MFGHEMTWPEASHAERFCAQKQACGGTPREAQSGAMAPSRGGMELLPIRQRAPRFLGRHSQSTLTLRLKAGSGSVSLNHRELSQTAENFSKNGSADTEPSPGWTKARSLK
jgi:hypothetical protein